MPLGHVLPLPAPLLGGTLAFGHALGSGSSYFLRRTPTVFFGPRRCAGIGLGALAADRQVAPVAQAAVRADLDQALDVQGHLAAQVALDLVAPVDDLAQPVDLLLGEVPDPGVRVDVGLGEDLLAGRQADPVDVGQGDLDPLLARDVDAGDACHRSTPAAACAWDWCR